MKSPNRKLESGDVDSGSSKIEGRVGETVKEIAEQLKKAFEQQGWIK